VSQVVQVRGMLCIWGVQVDIGVCSLNVRGGPNATKRS
jgi:hypothetical protein